MTATATAPLHQQAGAATGNGSQFTPSEPLWPREMTIDVLGVTGAYQAGKTIFMQSIAPGPHPAGHKYAGRPRTRLYDLEKSAGTYRGFGSERIDGFTALQDKFPTGYRPIQKFTWFYESIKSIQPGQFDVVAVDTIGDVETGLADYIKSKYIDYGFKSEDAFESTGGIFWSYVREFWKTTLANIRCQTFTFSSHLITEWSGGKPTSRKKPAGKSTLMELCSLYLVLDRSPDASGKSPEEPRCKFKIKDRLAITDFDPVTKKITVHPCLPPAFDNATPERIRQYIIDPPNYDKLKKDERIKEEVMSEEDRRASDEKIAEDRRAAEETALARLNRQAELQELARQAREASERKPAIDQSQRVNATATVAAAEQAHAAAQADAAAQAAAAKAKEPPFDVPADQVKAKADATAASATTSTTSTATTAPSTNGSTVKASKETLSRLETLRVAINMPPDRFAAGVRKNTGGTSDNPADLTQAQADVIVKGFEKALADKEAKELNAKK